ncbi:MAG: S41 family peptidase, partial [Planctomycetota bacterium]
MRRFCLSLLVISAVFSLAANAQESPSKLMRYADTWGKKVVFTYEGDLWLVAREGGTARRLTSGEGNEIFAKFSPDGNRIAFTATYDGGADIYVMNLSGGAPQRITFHPGTDMVQEWYPGGEWMLFRSIGRNYPSRDFTLWKVRADGGMPERLPIDRGGLASLSGDGKAVVYNRIAREFATWKRYMGGMAMNLWICRLEEGRFEKITSHLGNDNWPMWDGDNIYYASDMVPGDPETLGRANIFKYSLKDRSVTQITHHAEYDVKFPSRGGPGDEVIVYQNAGQLYLLDLDTNESKLIPVTIPSDQVPTRETHYPVQDYLGSFGLSATGVRMVFDSRGDLFTVPVDKGSARCLTEGTSASREKNPVWSPDGRRVAFYSDKTGEEELYLVDQKGEGDWIQLTSKGKGFRLEPVWSPDSK